ncbi:MAG: hypothetical protein IJB86_09395 [Clostridia bacterium]|nr:hypothetical protein [Clostridia bacterium]
MAKYRCTTLDGEISLSTTISKKDLHFYSVRVAPFKVYGLYNIRDGKPFRRMPEEVAKATSPSVAELNFNTAGGRIRFATDSECIALKVTTPGFNGGHMFRSFIAENGFDMFVNGKFYAVFKPEERKHDEYDAVVSFPDRRMRNIEINFPTYCKVNEVYIGLEPTSALREGVEYRHKKHIVYYGSSITQGAIASRPGNAYQAIISRRYDCNFINLGFSGSGKAEDAVVKYMSELDMSMFVCDYDHNAPDPQYLKDTHEKLYRAIRASHRNIPIIFVTRPDYDTDETDSAKRRNIVHETFLKAVSEGDRLVSFIDGKSLYHGMDRDCCTADGCHPNDAGLVRMADVIGEQISYWLGAMNDE